MWDRIGGWSNGPQMKTPVGGGVESSATGEVRMFVEPLQIVKSLLIRVPHINRGTLQRSTIGAEDGPAHKHRGTVQMASNIGAVRITGRCDIKGAKHRRLRSAYGQPMIVRIDQHRYSQSIREQNELLAGIAAQVTCLCEKANAPFPFGLCGLNLADKGVQMTHECFTDLSNAHIR